MIQLNHHQDGLIVQENQLLLLVNTNKSFYISNRRYFYIDKFVAFKTPLDDRYKTYIPADKRWTCSMLIKHVKDDQV